MPLDAGPFEVMSRLEAHCDELAGAYEEIDAALAAQDWCALDGLSVRLIAAQRAMAPLAQAFRALEATAASHPILAPRWRALGVRVGRLAIRRATLEEAARAARASAAAALARLLVGRMRVAHYRAPVLLPPRFTSRRI